MASTQSFVLMPVPKWYIADLVGLPLGGGYLAAYSSLDQTSQKLIYMSADNSSPWPLVAIPNTNQLGILFDENGSQGPFYFLFDSTVPDDLYYLEVYDADGVLQWTIDDFNPGQGAGGSVVTTANNLQNQIINSSMWRNNIGTSLINTSTFMLVAPGAHAALSNNSANAAGLYTGSDIVFIKNNSTATDKIQFPLFTPLGVNILTGDVTPVDYCHYECSIAGSSENVKCVQFPLVSNVQNLSDQAVTFKIWAKSSTSSQITLKWLQFFGDGSGSATVNPTITTLSLTPTWSPYTITTSVPDATGKTLGSCGNSATFFQIQYPLNNTCSVDFTLPRMYLGNLIPQLDFQTYDVIESTIDTDRTGHIRTGLLTTVIPGYLLMNDLTIGSASSGATNRANLDTFPLFNLLWTNITSQTGGTNAGGTGYAQLYDSAGVAIATVGASAVADFVANRRIGLTKQLGRALCSAGLATGFGVTTWALGQYGGTQAPSIAVNQLPQHQHFSPPGTSFITNVTVGGGQYADGSTGAINGNTGGIQGFTSQAGFDVTQPSSFVNFFIKL